MKSLKVEFIKDEIKKIDGVESEDWQRVCEIFSDDVHRLKDIEKDIYTGLYECFDDDNNSMFYIVEEDEKLKKIRRKNFIENIGMD
ncbi:MAG: hypothetical protein GY714_01355 [Desulfobacterales bacterium]|nr:hypothetical protein [Desulfobacterales bacterium]MCP4159192.1 hypothetical protein [Deltaproteobacteria bacterium]